MPSIDDVFAELQQINKNLQVVQSGLSQINNSLNAGFRERYIQLQNIVTLNAYADRALFQLSSQDAAIICILKKICQQTCTLLNEAHLQTSLQVAIKEHATRLAELYKSVHGEAAVTLEQFERLHHELVQCCPPDQPKPVCVYQACQPPPPLPEPPELPAPISWNPVSIREHLGNRSNHL